MALVADLGVADVAADLRRRYASLPRAQSFIFWRAQGQLMREWTDLIGVIETRIAPEAPDTAFELLWSLMLCASRSSDYARGRFSATPEITQLPVHLWRRR